MSTVKYLPEALEDLFEIWEYIRSRRQSEEAADRLIDSIDDAARIWATQPQMGQLRQELHSDVRSFAVHRFVVFYLPQDDGIEILQVIHGHRDIPAHFRGPQIK